MPALIPALSLAFAAPAVLAQQAVPTPAPAQAEPPVPAGQLTDAVRPERYRLDMTLDPAQPGFSGHTEIDVVLKAASPFIDMHGRGLTVGKVEARVGGRVIPGQWEQRDPSGVARVRFGEVLPVGPLTLAFDHEGTFGETSSGLFHTQVAGKWYGWSQFESIDARAAFPSFDQPSFKTPFSVTVRTPPGLVAVSNAPQTSVSSENGLDVHRFADTLPLPTYLVALMTGPFAAVGSEVAPTPQRATPLPLRVITTQPNANRMAFALDGSKGIVALLEDYFGDAFPYPKLDQITSPLMPGAMENAGADLYADPILIMDQDAPTADKRTFGMVVAHELAHQWFGDLVTPAWWDDIWLNESFANWMGYRIGGAWRPDLNIAAGALEEGFRAMQTDALMAGRPIRQIIATNAQIDEAFDTITYGKGGHVVAMIAAFMGDAKFREGVRRYMAAHRYGNATSTDFFGAMADAAGDPRIVPAMKSFTDQQGVPLITFTRGGAGWQVSQSRYAPIGATPPPTRWGVPMCVRQDGARACQLLVDAHGEITSAGNSPLIPNAGGTGYYRFELPDADWDALIAGARSLDGGEALALADSLDASVRAGRARAARLGALARVLADHPDSYAAAAPIDELAGLANSGVVSEQGRKGWRRLQLALFRPMLARMGFDPRAGAYAGEDPEVSQKRAQLVDRLAGSARDPAVRKRLLAATRAYLAGDTKALDSAWLGSGLELYVGRGGLAAARTLLDAALASEDPAFRPAAIAAIATSGSRGIARWMLDDVSDPRLRSSEQRTFIAGALVTRPTRDMAYAWLISRIDGLLAGSQGIFFASRMPQWLRRFCSVEDAQRIAGDLRPRLKGKTGELELERVIETVNNCAALRAAKGEEISEDFAKF